MKALAEWDFERLFTGNATFDLAEKKHRFRPFLPRNIMRVLSYHERRSRRIDLVSPPPMINGRKSTSPQSDALIGNKEEEEDTKPRITRWSLRDLAKQDFGREDAELSFELRSLRKKTDGSAGGYKELERPSKRVKREEILCNCYLAIWDNRAGSTGTGTKERDLIVKRAQQCIVWCQNNDEDPYSIDVEMGEPFRFKAAELFVRQKGGRSTPSKLAMGSSYYLETKIIPIESTDIWPPIPFRGKSESALSLKDVNESTLTHGMLIANYSKLPTAPPSDVLLSIIVDQYGKTYKTKYGLEVKATWREAGTPLEKYNRIKRESPVTHLPTPLSEPDRIENAVKGSLVKDEVKNTPKELPTKSTVEIRYVFGIEGLNGESQKPRQWITEGFWCPFCRTRDRRSWTQLFFHLKNNHDNFKFEAETNQDPPAGVDELIVVKVDIVEGYRERAANHVPDNREFLWGVPKRPFDLKAYNAGDESWVGTMASQRRDIKALPSVVSFMSSPKKEKDTKVRFKQPSNVQDLPKSSPKRYPVPKAAPNVTYFRATGKRALHRGELLSESDDDVDTLWLKQKHSESLDHLTVLTEAEKAFFKEYDAHLLLECLPSSRYLSDVLVRFARANKKLLQKPEMLQEFLKNASNLADRGVINESLVVGCLRIIQGAEERTEVSAGKLTDVHLSQREDEMDIDAVEKVPGGAKARAESMEFPLRNYTYNTCVKCGTFLGRKKLAITCTNTTCQYKDASYHLSCVGLTSRQPDWRCPCCPIEEKK